MVATSNKNRTKKAGRIWFLPVTALVFIIAVVVVLKWGLAGSPRDKDEPGILRNLTTMTGKMAPAFSLNDSEGKTHRIAPGEGRKHVLIFHMGSI